MDNTMERDIGKKHTRTERESGRDCCCSNFITPFPFTFRYGTDIGVGALTWVITTSLEIATPAQKEVLINNYGKEDRECVEKVRQVFMDQDIFGIYRKLVVQNAADVEEGIERFCNKYPQIPASMFRAFQVYLDDPHAIHQRMETKHVPPPVDPSELLPKRLLQCFVDTVLK